VAFAAERLRRDFSGDAGAREYAIARLEDAGDRHETDAAELRRFMFDEPAPGEPPPPPPPPEAVLALAAADLQVGSVLIAAADATGQGGAGTSPEALDAALAELGAARRGMLADADAIRAGGRFAFDEPPVAAAAAGAEPAAEFEGRAEAALDVVLAGLAGTAEKVIDKFPWAERASAVAALGRAVPTVPRIGRLMTLGASKIRAAFDALARLVDSRALQAIRDKVDAFLEQSRGRLVRATVEQLVDARGVRTHVNGAITSPSFDPTAVPAASVALDDLGAGFRGKLRYLNYGVAASGLLGTVGTLTGRLELVAASAAALVLTLAVATLVALDHADSTRLLNLVAGIRRISDGVHGH